MATKESQTQQPEQNPDEIPISVSVLRQVLSYLAEKPYKEAVNHISAIEREISRAVESGKYPRPK